jgi:hypothetical protein
MKKLNLILGFLFIISFVSCEVETEDVITKEAVEAGVSVQLSESTAGKLLGAPIDPSDLENTSLSFNNADTQLFYKLNLKYLGESISNYQVYKSLNYGDEVLVTESTTLPIEISYGSVDDFIGGLGISADDLRVGDVFRFRAKVITNSGEEYFIHDGGDNTGTMLLTVNCASDLAYEYEVITTGYYGSINQGIELLVEKSPGLYKTVTTGGWSAGSIAPDQGFDFQDICGSLVVPDQDLCQGYYSNDVYQTALQAEASVLDGSTGNLHIEYTISFSSGDQAIATDYIKL